MGPFTKRFRPASLAVPGLWSGILLSLAVGLLFYVITLTLIERDANERFAGHARNGAYNIGARIKSYTDVLRGTASLFQTNYPITREQFHHYVDGLQLELDFPAIETMNFAHYLHDDERAEFEKQAQAGLKTTFRIFPAGRRPTYDVLTFIEPEKPGASKIGFDLSANPLILPTLQALRDNGVLITSGMPIAAMSAQNRTGLGMRLPIYRPNMPFRTLAERRAAFIGSVGIAFAVHLLVKGVLDEIPIKNVRMLLIDNALGVNHKRGLVLFDSDAAPGRSPPDSSSSPVRFYATLPVDFNGREWAVTFSVDKPNMYSGFEERAPLLAMLAGSVSTILLYALFHSLSSSRKRAITMAKAMTRELRDSEAKLQLSHQNLRRLAAHADKIKEGERKRIAREIHDDLGQNLLALRIEADMLSSRTSAHHPHLHARAQSTLAQIDATIKSVRQIINDLRPNVLDLGLSAAVEWLIADFVRRNGIECELFDEQNEISLDDSAATALFRILQESLSNIVRHAHATSVRVRVRMIGPDLSMTISDNGMGMLGNERYKFGSFGLVGIEERVNILGGSFSISSIPGEGTTVSVSVPSHLMVARTAPPHAAHPVIA